MTPPVVLTIAGSDPSGGAGIQGDLKTFTALGAYGTAVITALTAQSTQGVTGIHTVPPEFVVEQLQTLFADITVDAVKIGMLAAADTIAAVGQFMQAYPDLPVVLDPVMVSTSGPRLLAADAVDAMLALLPRVALLTPNLPEAAILTGTEPATDLDAMRAQAARLIRLGTPRVLLKGGHLAGAQAVDVWLDDRGEELLTSPRVATRNTHGTGCALSSAIAALAPRADTLLDAARHAKEWLTGSLRAADTLQVGHGPGPVHHCHDLWQTPSAQWHTTGLLRPVPYQRIDRVVPGVGRMRDHGPVTADLARTEPWPAPTIAGPVRATVPVPGSKSLTNRALLLAAQATAPSVIKAPLRSRDTDLMADALRALGVEVSERRPAEVAAERSSDWVVRPARLRGPATVDCGLAGTVMRFVPPLAATATGPVTFDGDAAARRRPMSTILEALRALGADVDGDALPFTLHGTGSLPGGVVRIDASASSQFVSGLLLSAPSFDRGIDVRHDGPALPSQPHIDMTVQALRSVGVKVDDSQRYRWIVEPGPVSPWPTVIEPDLSNATPFLAAAMVTGGSVRVPHWPAATTQAGDAIRAIFERMGGSVDRTGEGLTISGPDRIRALQADLHDIGELTPTVAAVALFADGPSTLSGIGHLRGHETDRLAALAANIRALGGDVTEEQTALTIRPRALHGGEWPAYADHRMATAGAIVGLRVAGIHVDDISSTGKTLPGFARMWSVMLGSPQMSAVPR